MEWVTSLRDDLQPFARGGVRQPTGRNERKACAGGVRSKLCSAGGDQEKVRPQECAAIQPETSTQIKRSRIGNSGLITKVPVTGQVKRRECLIHVWHYIPHEIYI
jgi:hypothetical protein